MFSMFCKSWKSYLIVKIHENMQWFQNLGVNFHTLYTVQIVMRMYSINYCTVCRAGADYFHVFYTVLL